MLMNEFNQRYFRPQSEEQQSLLDRFLTLRSMYGHPSRFGILRNLAKTMRHYLRHLRRKFPWELLPYPTQMRFPAVAATQTT